MEARKIAFYLAGLAIMLAIVFLPGYSSLHKLREENEQLQRRIKLLESHNDQLEAELGRMKQDPDYVEKVAREKLGIVKEGEIIYRKNGGN